MYTSLCVHKSSLADVSMHSMHSPCIKLVLGLSFSHILLGYTLLNLVLEYTLLNLVCDYAYMYVYTSLCVHKREFERQDGIEKPVNLVGTC